MPDAKPTDVFALITDGFGQTGGIAQYNCALLSALAECGSIRAIAALPRNGESMALDKIRQFAGAQGRIHWSGRAAVRVVMHEFGIIFCGHLFAAPLALALARVRSSRFWLQAHGIEAWEKPSAAIRWSAERADLITCVSRYTRSRLLAWADIDPARVRVVPNTVSSNFSVRPRRYDLIKKYGLVGRKVILTVGRIAKHERYKGHDRIIASLDRVAMRCPSVIYLVVGTGDDVERLRSQTITLGVADRVIFVGQVKPSDLPDYFALADVFAMPSTGEGFGIVFLEAARSGLPIIAGNVDGSFDALAEGEIGRLIDPTDENQLVEALSDALGTTGRRSASLVERFSFEHFARHLDELLDHFLRA